jgi:cell division cycle 20-like protein 1 (cofactor of APC complex)
MSPAHDPDDCVPKKAKRKIPKVPFKVLDAPALQDDFYLNLVDWSSTNVLAVGLGSCVYLWSACTSRVTKLCDLDRGVSTHRADAR